MATDAPPLELDEAFDPDDPGLPARARGLDDPDQRTRLMYGLTRRLRRTEHELRAAATEYQVIAAAHQSGLDGLANRIGLIKETLQVLTEQHIAASETPGARNYKLPGLARLQLTKGTVRFVVDQDILLEHVQQDADLRQQLVQRKPSLTMGETRDWLATLDKGDLPPGVTRAEAVDSFGVVWEASDG